MKIKNGPDWLGKTFKCGSCGCKVELEKKDKKRIHLWEDDGRYPGSDNKSIRYYYIYITCPRCRGEIRLRGVRAK